MSHKVEKVQKGGSAPEIKKSTIQNMDFLIRGGKRANTLVFFTNVIADLKCFSWKNKLVLKCFPN